MSTGLLILLVCGSITIRSLVARHSHSGQNLPPMYGDYEAQRHWQEITVNLPINEWYFNSTSNDLNYWGLDYPPLTAYHSWLVGKAAEQVNSSYTALETSRGMETDNHRFFMRSVVLFMDLITYIPAVIYFANTISGRDVSKQVSSVSTFLFYPGLILIDHGHYQYNGVSLGLMLAAATFVLRGKDCLGSLFFVAALSYKQMELYHALPFFFYILGEILYHEKTWKSSIVRLFLVGGTVIFSFVLIWFPFLLNLKQFAQVLHRVFPLARGVFEDKVSNFWCVLNIVVKIKENYNSEKLAFMCLITTALSSLPSNMMLFFQPSKSNFVFALVNTSLAFFLFSFQVHEKSILLVAIPVLMLLSGAREGYGRYTSAFASWMLIVTSLSMFPLLQKDGLSIATGALSGFFITVLHGLDMFKPGVILESKKSQRSPKPIQKNQVLAFIDWAVCIMIFLSISGFITFCYLLMFVKPPPSYPHLWQLMISAYSCVHFLMFFSYFNKMQFNSFLATRRAFEAKQRVKKSS